MNNLRITDAARLLTLLEEMGRDRASYSFLNTFQRCSRLFFYRYVKRLEPNRDAAPLVAGRSMHAALDVWWMKEDRDEAMAALEREWGDFEPSMGGDYSHLTLGHAINVLDRYIERGGSHMKGFRPMMLSLDDLNWRHLAHIDATTTDEGALLLSESPMIVKILPELDFPVEVRIDFPAVKGEDQLYIVDRKCKMSWMTQRSIDYSVGVGHQLRTYQAAMELITRREYDGTVIEGIYMGKDPKSGWPNVKSEPLGMYGPWYWDRDEIEETKHWISATLDDIGVALERMNRYDESGEPPAYAWPQNDNGGCPRCFFKTLCEVPEPVRKVEIEKHFQEREERR
jgi:hypothetical protein